MLINKRYEILCVDNFLSESRISILHLLNNLRFIMIRHSITFPLCLEVDEIAHSTEVLFNNKADVLQFESNKKITDPRFREKSMMSSV